MNTHFLATAVNDAAFGPAQRGRTVPIPETITAVPGYPSKLVLYKMPASRFWQVRCWFKGKTYKRSTHRLQHKFQHTSLRKLMRLSPQLYLHLRPHQPPSLLPWQSLHR